MLSKALIVAAAAVVSTGVFAEATCPPRTYPIDPSTTWWVAVYGGAVVGTRFRWPSTNLTQPPPLEPGWSLLQEIPAPARPPSRLYASDGYSWRIPESGGGCAFYGPSYTWRPWGEIAAAIEEEGVAATEQCARALQVGPLRGISSGARLCMILDPDATDPANAAMRDWCRQWRTRCAQPNLAHGLAVLAELGDLQDAPPNLDALPPIESGWVVVPAPEVDP